MAVGDVVVDASGLGSASLFSRVAVAALRAAVSILILSLLLPIAGCRLEPQKIVFPAKADDGPPRIETIAGRGFLGNGDDSSPKRALQTSLTPIKPFVDEA